MLIFFTNSYRTSQTCSLLLKNAVNLNQLFAERMLQPSRFARCRGSACKACAFFLHPYRGLLRGFVLPQKRKLNNNPLAEPANARRRCEQGGSHSSSRGRTGCRRGRPGRQPARSWRGRTKNHRVDSGKSPKPRL